MAAGQGIKGFFLLGRGIRFVKGIRLIEGFAKEDIVWKEILKESRMGGKMAMAGFWLLVVSISLALAAASEMTLLLPETRPWRSLVRPDSPFRDCN